MPSQPRNTVKYQCVGLKAAGMDSNGCLLPAERCEAQNTLAVCYHHKADYLAYLSQSDREAFERALA